MKAEGGRCPRESEIIIEMTSLLPLLPPMAVAFAAAPHAALVSSSSRSCSSCCRIASPPAAIEDGAVVLAAAALVGAAGALQFSLSSGEKGINAFLMKEARDNPFYKPNFKSDKPTGPSWLSSIKLPQFDFVEVYGQPGGGSGSAGGQSSNSDMSPELAALYRKLDAAVEVEDYDEAARVKAQIDEALLSSDR